MKRPGGGAPGGPSHNGRDGPRGAPPEATGAETAWLQRNMEARTRMVVRLVDGEELRGWIEYYDRDMIKLNRERPPHLFIRKRDIKYIHEDRTTAFPSGSESG